MSLQTWQFLLFGSLGLSVLFGNSVALAQSNTSSDSVVVPTGTTRTRTTRTRSTSTSSPGNSSTQINRTRTIDNSTSNGSSRSRSRTTTRSTSSSPVTTATRFNCSNYNGEYTVMYQPETQPGQYFAWATPKKMGGGWDAVSRCNKIAERLERYRPDGLTELRTSSLNGYNVLCVTSEKDPSCRLVLTVPPDKDPYQVRNNVFENLISADSGQQTAGVSTYSPNNGDIENIVNMGRSLFEGSKKRNLASDKRINLKPFLDRKDGGSGNQLKKGVELTKPKNQSGLDLNTDRLR